MDVPVLKDLPPRMNDELRNVAAERKIRSMGDKWSNNGEEWVNAAKQASQRNNVPLYYISSTIDRENSQWNPALKNNASSSVGLGQFVKSTAHHLQIDPRDPIQSIHGIADYLGELKNRGYDNFADLTKAYVLGPTGYSKYKSGETNVKGLDQLPLVNKFLAQNGLLDENAPLMSRATDALPLSPLANMFKGVLAFGDDDQPKGVEMSYEEHTPDFSSLNKRMLALKDDRSGRIGLALDNLQTL